MPKRTNVRERLTQALESQNPTPCLLGPPGALGAEGGRGALYSGNPMQGSSCSGLRVTLYREGFDSADRDAQCCVVFIMIMPEANLYPR